MKTNGSIRAALLDFDGTLVTEDFSDRLADLNGKKAESEHLNAEFQAGRLAGITGLVQRVNMLDGITLTQVHDLLAGDAHLMPGVIELFEYFRANDIVSIVASGSILPVLEYYQRLLGIDYVVGTAVELDGDVIRGVSRTAPPVDGFKLTGCMRILTELGIPVHQAAAVGDSPADAALMLHAGLSIAVNPVGGVEQYADHVISCDLTEALTLIESHNSTRP
jgi:HAD superfamily phosphoserine phosphatase-like hydrolase